METKKKEQNTKAEAETFAATVKGMNRDDQLMLNGFLLGLGAAKALPRQPEQAGGKPRRKKRHEDYTRFPGRNQNAGH